MKNFDWEGAAVALAGVIVFGILFIGAFKEAGGGL